MNPLIPLGLLAVVATVVGALLWTFNMVRIEVQLFPPRDDREIR